MEINWWIMGSMIFVGIVGIITKFINQYNKESIEKKARLEFTPRGIVPFTKWIPPKVEDSSKTKFFGE